MSRLVLFTFVIRNQNLVDAFLLNWHHLLFIVSATYRIYKNSGAKLHGVREAWLP